MKKFEISCKTCSPWLFSAMILLISLNVRAAGVCEDPYILFQSTEQTEEQGDTEEEPKQEEAIEDEEEDDEPDCD